jgi:hypothetical protein
MFDVNKSFWFKLKGIKKNEVNVKGRVLEENNFFVKIQLDDGKESIIPFVRVLDVNEIKEEYKQGDLNEI